MSIAVVLGTSKSDGNTRLVVDSLMSESYLIWRITHSHFLITPMKIEEMIFYR